MKPWTLAAVIVAAIFYVVALSSDVYSATSPSWLSWHVLLRKIYSVGAFTLVAYLFRRALDEWPRSRFLELTTIAAVSSYSAAMEFGQAFAGSKEGLAWNAVDVLCGALGGFLALAIDRTTRRTARP